MVYTRCKFLLTIVSLLGFVRLLPDCGGGGSSGKKATASQPFLTVSGHARFTDENKNATCDSGDKIVVPFNRDVAVNNADEDDFSLPATGDSLGTGVTITLGTGPFVLKSRQKYGGASRSANNPSGIDVRAIMAANAIETATAGRDAEPSTPIDITPAFVNSSQSLGANWSMDVEVADVDGDGDIDLDFVEGNAASEANRVWLNDGSGIFTDSGASLGSGNTDSIDMADVDSDGDIDCVEGNYDEADALWGND